jgi:hypothetical protein
MAGRPEICAELSHTGRIICRIVTNNASNDIAILRDIPDELGTPVFRIPCRSHTTALTLKDFIGDAFHLISGGDFFAAMIDLRKLLPHVRERDTFHGIPPRCETRWTSLGKFAYYPVCYCDHICAFLQDKFRFEQLAPCFTLMNTYVE